MPQQTVSLYLKCLLCKQFIVGSYFFNQSTIFSFYYSVSFNVFINIVRLKSTFALICFICPFCSLFLFLSFPVFFWITQLCSSIPFYLFYCLFNYTPFHFLIVIVLEVTICILVTVCFELMTFQFPYNYIVKLNIILNIHFHHF